MKKTEIPVTVKTNSGRCFTNCHILFYSETIHFVLEINSKFLRTLTDISNF